MIGKILNWFGTDGLAHVLVSLILCAVLAAFLPWWAAALITLAIGVAKELIWDRWMGRGTADWHDIICDALGIVGGVVIEILNALYV